MQYFNFLSLERRGLQPSANQLVQYYEGSWPKLPRLKEPHLPQIGEITANTFSNLPQLEILKISPRLKEIRNPEGRSSVPGSYCDYGREIPYIEQIPDDAFYNTSLAVIEIRITSSDSCRLGDSEVSTALLSWVSCTTSAPLACPMPCQHSTRRLLQQECTLTFMAATSGGQEATNCVRISQIEKG